jgi:hypothetical protein
MKLSSRLMKFVSSRKRKPICKDKQQEEEEKRRKDEEEAKQLTTEIKSPPKVTTMSTQEYLVADFSKNIYDVMNRVDTSEESPNND